MKTIILVRHAKATKSMMAIDDIDRPLVEEGIRDAYFMGLWLKNNKHIPDLIITSPAVRAYGTGMVMARMLEYPLNKIKINHDLYEKGHEGYCDTISSIKKEQKTVMLFGHNPDISGFAMWLCEKFNINMPTAGIVGIDLKIDDWEEINDARGSLKFFEFPK
jgi:phosphohistidine phosphatase